MNHRTKWKIGEKKTGPKISITFKTYSVIKRKPLFGINTTDHRYSKQWLAMSLILAGSVFIPKNLCCWWRNPYGLGNFSCCLISSWYVSNVCCWMVLWLGDPLWNFTRTCPWTTALCLTCVTSSLSDCSMHSSSVHLCWMFLVVNAQVQHTDTEGECIEIWCRHCTSYKTLSVASGKKYTAWPSA